MAGGDPITEQANELNRILGAGRAGLARVNGHVDTGEQVEGNPVWVFQLEVTPENGPSYLVRRRSRAIPTGRCWPVGSIPRIRR